MNHYEEVKDCIHFCDRINYRCELKIVESFATGKKYNCVQNGRCASYTSEEQHKKEAKENQEEWEKKTYERLKKKFEK